MKYKFVSGCCESVMIDALLYETTALLLIILLLGCFREQETQHCLPSLCSTWILRIAFVFFLLLKGGFPSPCTKAMWNTVEYYLVWWISVAHWNGCTQGSFYSTNIYRNYKPKKLQSIFSTNKLMNTRLHLSSKYEQNETQIRARSQLFRSKCFLQKMATFSKKVYLPDFFKAFLPLQF